MGNVTGKIITIWLLLLINRIWLIPAENVSPLPEFEAVAGSTAEIPCHVPLRPPQSGIKCIFWYKDDEVMSVYTIDARPGSHNLHVPSDKLKERATFDPSPWPPVLKMTAVKAEDAGVYYCRVDYKHDRTDMYTTVLKIIVPPKKMLILDEYEDEMNAVAGPYLEGRSVHLICEAIGGKPAPLLTWWMGKKPLKGGKSYPMHETVVRSNYSFVPKRSDLMSKITCQSVNNNITLPRSVSVKIDLYLRPANIHMTPRGVSLTANRRYEIRCSSEGSRPPARMSWFLGKEPLSNNTDLLSSDRNRTTSVLSYWPSRSDHEKYLRCKTENFLLQGSDLEEGWTLNITYLPLVSMHLKSFTSRTTLLEGDDVRFICEVKANPPVTDIGWLFEGKPVKPDDEIDISYRSLLVRRVRRSHRGRYQCYANNAEGSGFSRVITLRAMHAPVCAPGLKTTYSISTGEIAPVECQVDADPPKVRFQWSFSNGIHRHYNVSYTSAGLRSVASFKPANTSDFGTLYCWGANSVGEQQKPCIFTVIPMGSPEKLKNCSATNISMSSVSINCETPSGDTKLRYYLEMYLQEKQTSSFFTSHTSPVFYVPNLSPNTELLFAIYAVNVNGKSSPVWVQVKTLPAPVEGRVFHQPGKDGKEQPWFGLSLLICGAAGCLLVTVVLVLWKRFRVAENCEKCKDLPKQFHFKKGFTKSIKADKMYIDRMPEIWDQTACM